MANRYQKAVKLLLELKKNYDRVSIDTLRSAIIRNCGGDEQRVVVPYLELMREMGMIKETIKGWKILISQKTLK